MRRRLLIVLAIVIALVGGVVATVAGTSDGGGERAATPRPTVVAREAADAPTFDPSMYTELEVDSLDPDPLPVPAHSPEDPYADVPVEQIGTVEIPAIGLTHPVYEGVTLTVINRGPGHWPGSALPGRRGNTVFPGHRTTYTHPFLDLDRLEQGDAVIFHMPDGDHRYAVSGTQVVTPTDMWVVDQTETPTFTIIACHPKHSARQRIVVKGTLVSSTPSPAALELARLVGEAGARTPV